MESQVRGEDRMDWGREGQSMMEGGGSLHSVAGREGAWEVEWREPMAMRTLWLDNEEVSRCQPTPFTQHGSDPKVSTS